MEGQKLERANAGDLHQVENTAVRRWRQSQFWELGFSLADARTLADSPAELAEARRLIATGCPHTLAYRIVR